MPALISYCLAFFLCHQLNGEELEWLDAFHATCRADLTAEYLRSAVTAPVPASEPAAVEARVADVQAALAWLNRETEPIAKP